MSQKLVTIDIRRPGFEWGLNAKKHKEIQNKQEDLADANGSARQR